MEHWIQELLVNLDENVDETVKREILQNCGPKCPFSHMPNEKLLELRDKSCDEKDFLEKLSNSWHLRMENDTYFVVFDQCYCPLVNGDIHNSSKTMCYCTLGSLKHKFKIGLGRDIEIKMLKTVLRGDDECRFEVMI